MSELLTGILIALFVAFLAILGWIGKRVWKEMTDTHDVLRSLKDGLDTSNSTIKQRSAVIDILSSDVTAIKIDLMLLKKDVTLKPCKEEMNAFMERLRRHLIKDKLYEHLTTKALEQL